MRSTKAWLARKNLDGILVEEVVVGQLAADEAREVGYELTPLVPETPPQSPEPNEAQR